MRAAHAAFALAVLALAAAPTAHAEWGLPEALTERGQTVGHIYDIIMVLGVLVFVIVFVWLVVVIWRFRETTGHGRATHERERHNIWAELAWFTIPLIMVMSIGFIAYAGLVKLDNGIPPSSVPAENEVRITGSQWSWAAEYSNGVRLTSDPDPVTGAVKNESVFYVPQDKPILFNIASTDVIHAFQLLDANRAFVIFNDANPLGANKYNLQVATLPAGDYFVQCNKMCLNPGHAIMRARIKSVPQGDYDLWLNERHAAGGAAIVQSVPLKLVDGHVVGADGKPAGPFTVVSSAPGTRVVLTLPKPAQDVTFTVAGAEKTIHAGESSDPFFAFTVDQPGNLTVHARTGENDDAITFAAVDAVRATVTLDSFKLTPGHLDLKAGTTYLVSIPNVSSSVHDLYIGHYNQGGASADVKWHSASVGGGASGAFIVTPDAAGSFEMWCNQPGHHDLGMQGTVTVG
ncbi:MAG: cytochrome c oxidase subunit II transmembrane domain-containing protein [Thermoplasmatota archaeon]